MTITINNFNWTVSFVPSFDKEKFGTTRYLTQEIQVLDSLSREETRRTITHELIHAFMHSYGFSQIDGWDTEVVCDFISTYADSIVKMTDEIMIGLGKEAK